MTSSLAHFEICATPCCCQFVEKNRTLHPDKCSGASLTTMQIYSTPQMATEALENSQTRAPLKVACEPQTAAKQH